MIALALAALLVATPFQESQSEPGFRVTPQRSLEIAGQPYVPVGLKIKPTPEAVAQAKEAGITDVLVELPLDIDAWKAAIQLLEQSHMRYVIGINALAPSAEVVAVEPQSYRVSGLKGDLKVDLEIPGATKAYAILASEQTGALIWQGVVPIENGRFKLERSNGFDGPCVLVLYPVLKDQRMTDYWEGFDSYRDQLLAVLKEAKPGPGFSALLNPIGQIAKGFSADDTAIPTSEMFRVEMETYLRQKYGTPEMAAASWSMSASSLDTFAELARSVPLWQGSRGIDYLWNVEDGRTSGAERRTQIWDDYRAVTFSSAMRRLNRLIEAIKAETGRPVIQDWTGWGGPYEDREATLDAVGFRVDASTMGEVIDQSARPLSSSIRRGKSTACIATEISIGSGELAPTVGSALRQMENLGVKGWFFNADTPEEIAAVGEAAKLYRDSENIARNEPNVIFFPEAALNPAVAGRLPGGYVWLPAPGSGERLDLGEGLEGYRYSDGRRTTIAFWATTRPLRLKMRMASPTVPNFTVLDGSDLALVAKGQELEITVPTSPILLDNDLDLPVSISAFEASQVAIAYLIDTFGLLVDFTGTEYVKLGAYNNSFQRAPAATFIAVRDQLRTLLVRAAPYTWLEGELPTETNFGDIRQVPGASGGSALMLDSKIATLRPYSAHYTIKNRLGGKHEVWIAARLNDEAKAALQVQVGGTEMRIQGKPVSPYGPGFAWYKCGEITLPQGQTVLTITAPPEALIACDIDLVMVSPGEFTPNGPYPPNAWLWNAVNQARPPEGRGSRD